MQHCVPGVVIDTHARDIIGRPAVEAFHIPEG